MDGEVVTQYRKLGAGARVGREVARHELKGSFIEPAVLSVKGAV